ncbi:cyclin-G2-like isoform X2 [Gouania willdenowi]|uniref:cyclin-G2-like isoform X2 n=1 Tax=Gouania willdenowi TaxID=441366 RepID=UPI001054D353|nr:cyclin-G2-like isoform X2 [Gouania willdenowi]
MRDCKEIDSLLLKELKSCRARESRFIPREAGFRLMESTSSEISLGGVSAKSRNIRVEEQWSLTSFFGYSTQTFVHAVNFFDRFLTTMKVQPKHLPCIGVCCLHIAAKMTEEENNVSPPHELIRISHSKFTVSDLCRMEKIILEKLSLEPNAVTALTFLHLYYSAFTSPTAPRKDIPSVGRLEAQLKACLCQLVFSKAKPSVLALSLIAQEFENLPSVTSSKIVQQFQRYLKISDSDLRHWRKLVAQCMTEYSSAECNKPDNKKLVWIVSRRTAQNMQAGHFSVPGLPTIHERCWEESESDSCEDMSCGEESPWGSLGSDGEGAFFPSTFLTSRK